MAEERKTRPLVEICRRIRNTWSEECQKTFGGSFRYWNSGRMVFGVNVANNWGHSPGQLDVWIRTKALAETTGVAETETKETLVTYQPFDVGAVDCWIGLQDVSDTEKLVAQLKAWAGGGLKAAQTAI
jgi:hypothetical protein